MTIVLGFIYGASDWMGTDDVPQVLGQAALAGSLLASACGFHWPAATRQRPGLGCLGGWAGGGGLERAWRSQFQQINWRAGNHLRPAAGVHPQSSSIVFGVPADRRAWYRPLAAVALGVAIFATVPGIFNPTKLVSELFALIIAGIDVLMGLAGGGVQIVQALVSS